MKELPLRSASKRVALRFLRSRNARGRAARLPARYLGLSAVLAFAWAAFPVRESVAQDLPDPPEILESLQQHIRAVLGKCRGAVVRIEAEDEQGRLSGTGFLVDPNGTIYTSYTVGGDSRELVVTLGDMRFPAQRLASDCRSGIAILKIDAKTPFLPIGDSKDLEMAAPVMTVGYPMDLALTPSFGFVGGFDRKYLGRYFATTHIRANVPVQRGQGGAPLLNMKGEVVGILISSLDHGSGLFALPIDAAEKVRRDFIRFGEIRPGWLGMDVGQRAEVNGSTAQVQEVFPNAPAEKAGLRIGDTLLSVGSTKVANPEDVLDASFFLTAQEDVIVRISRDGAEMEVHVMPSDSPRVQRSAQILGSLDLHSSEPLQIVPGP